MTVVLPLSLLPLVVLGALAPRVAHASPTVGSGVLYPDANTRPVYVAAGSDGNLWYTDSGGSCSYPACGDLIQVTPTGTTTYNQPYPSGGYSGALTSGPDGNLYVVVGNQFTATLTNTIAQVGLTYGPVMNWQVPVSKGLPNDLAPGPDGNIWFTAADTSSNIGYVGFVTPAAKIKEFTLASGSGLPQAIVSGADGALWVTLDSGNVGRLTTSGVVRTFAIPNGLSPTSGGRGAVALGPDGNVWFTASDPNTSQNYVVSVTPTGAFQEYPTLTLNPELAGITAGADGNLWFNEYGLPPTPDCPGGYGSGVGRVTPTGVMADFGAGCGDTNDQFNIVAGPDGNVWNGAYYGFGFDDIFTGAPSTCIPLAASATPSSVAHGAPETIAATIANCSTAPQLMKLTSKTIRPAACGAPITTTSHVPLQPLVQTVVSSTSTASRCKGTYTDKLTLSSGGTVAASTSVTYQVT